MTSLDAILIYQSHRLFTLYVVGIVCYIHDRKLYSANAGDSRAVLAQRKGQSLVAVALSDDQVFLRFVCIEYDLFGTCNIVLSAARPPAKATGACVSICLSQQALFVSQKPDREDEMKRILECKGRVEACKDSRGNPVGPKRVWLQHQDVPGLAMARAFGDQIAASVGVTARPEVWVRDITSSDEFMILGSDGIWEFISNEEAVRLVQHCDNPREACRILVDEAIRRWQAEEEVIDDITAMVVYFHDRSSA